MNYHSNSKTACEAGLCKELEVRGQEYMKPFGCPPKQVYCSHDIQAAYEAGAKAAIVLAASVVLKGGFHIARRNAAREVLDLIGDQND